MASMNNWLAFPLQSVDIQEQNQSQTSMIMNHFSQSDVGYRGSSSAGFELPSNSTSESLAMADMSCSLRATGDGSLCLFEAINRTHNAEWKQKCLSNQSAKSETLNNGHTIKEAPKRPKLEDLLGGAFVGGVQFSEDAPTDNMHTTEFDRIYRKATSFNGDSDHNSTMGDDTHMKVALEVNTDSSKQCVDQPDHETVRSNAMQNLYSNNNNASNGVGYNMFSDCSLQLSHNSGNNTMYGLSDFKTWLKSQSSEEPKVNNSNNNSFLCSAGSSQQATDKDNFALAIPANTQVKSPSAAVIADSPNAAVTNNGDSTSSESRKRNLEQSITPVEPTANKSLDTFGQRTSIYRGVTRHRWTGRYEAHLWDNSCRRDGQTRKGRQVYLGGYDKEDKAARAYDLAALKYWGPSTTTNFPISNYEKELEEMKNMTRQEYVASLRRKSSGFSRGASMYRGVTRHHQHGRWQARIGRVAGNKDLYLGTFSTQEEAAEAYDIAAIKFRGLNAVTNFDMSRYDVKSIMSSALPIGGLAKRMKEAELAHIERTVEGPRVHDEDSTLTSQTDTASYGNVVSSKEWPLLTFQQQQNPSVQAAYQQRGLWWKQSNENQSHHDFQMHLQPPSNHHKYLQPSMLAANGTVLHNLMGLESAAMNDVNNSSAGMYTGIGNGLVMPNSSIPSVNSSIASATENSHAAHFSDNSEGSVASKTSTYENMLSTDHSAKGLYYPTHQQSSGLGRDGYDNVACNNNNNWMTPSLQALGSRPNIAICHVPVFTVWNDS